MLGELLGPVRHEHRVRVDDQVVEHTSLPVGQQRTRHRNDGLGNPSKYEFVRSDAHDCSPRLPESHLVSNQEKRFGTRHFVNGSALVGVRYDKFARLITLAQNAGFAIPNAVDELFAEFFV